MKIKKQNLNIKYFNNNKIFISLFNKRKQNVVDKMILSTFCPRNYKISNIYNIDNTNNIIY